MVSRFIYIIPSTESPKVPKGYVTFPKGEVGAEGNSQLCYRDVTSPINLQDYNALDSSGGRNTGNHAHIVQKSVQFKMQHWERSLLFFPSSDNEQSSERIYLCTTCIYIEGILF